MNVDSNHETDGTMAQVVVNIRQLTPAQLGQLGVSQIAYVRAVMVNGEPGFAIHGADGTPMAVADNRDVALAAILQHDMVPVMVH